jgi:uncharacterized membrane protein
VGRQLFTFGAAFLGSAVESVEALTIVLAVGLTRGWRAPLYGTVAALVALAVLVVGLHIAPLPVLIGLVLLLAAQHIWVALAEARRDARSRPLPSPSLR